MSRFNANGERKYEPLLFYRIYRVYEHLHDAFVACVHLDIFISLRRSIPKATEFNYVIAVVTSSFFEELELTIRCAPPSEPVISILG